MKTTTNFMQKLAEGQAKGDDIDDAICEWHKLGLLNPMSLHSYLGMTRKEYVAWLECRSTPQEILDKRNKTICKICNDTHVMNDQGWCCTFCPIPCQKCRTNGSGAYCQSTPCNCSCHKRKKKNKSNFDPKNPGASLKRMQDANRKARKDQLDIAGWYQGPLTKVRLAHLRIKLAKARGLLYSFLDPDPQYHPDLEEIRNILKETEDP
jgi:hypothetical protein